MKGEIKPDHMPNNKYTLRVAGLIEFTVTTLSGIEDVLETTELPDRTVASAGFRKATEFTMSIPMHHTAEQNAMEVWYQESQEPVTPSYKKPVTLTHESISGGATRNYSLAGVFPKQRNLPDLERGAEGEMLNVEWVMSVDDILPL